VTIVGGGQHIVERPAGIGIVFGMMRLYDLPAPPSCTIAWEAHVRATGCD
jgi:hypothetical protein